MKHPSEAQLALHAGGDLGWWDGWRVERHIARCGECRDEVVAYASLRDITQDLREIPEIQWARLAGEMKANIRLGLAAGACVGAGDVEEPPAGVPMFGSARAALALASVLLLAVTGVVLERPAPKTLPPAELGVVLQTTSDGIQVRDGERSLGLRNGRRDEVIYSVSAQGSMRARYVDPKTDTVTINNVYAE